MEVSHQVNHQLNICIALYLGKMFKSPFIEKSDQRLTKMVIES